MTTTSDVTASIRDLIVNLRRGNNAPAESIVNQICNQLKIIMQSGMDPQNFPMQQRAQQTLFAIDEVQMLLAQRDMKGALNAARDAGNEWSRKPTAELGPV